MKKCIAILLCVCILSVTASASDDAPDFVAEYVTLFGVAPVADNFLSDEDYQFSYAIWASTLENYVSLRSAEYEQQKAEEAARLAVEREAAQEAAEAEGVATSPESVESADSNNEATEAEGVTAFSESTESADSSNKAAGAEGVTTFSESIESAGSNHEINVSVPVFSSPVNQYPDRVRVDLAGNIWSLDGELLSPGTTPAYAPASGSDEDAAILHDELADTDNLSSAVVDDTSAMMDGPASDAVASPPVWYVDDLRPADLSEEVLTGLKSMVTSIFGEYTPVTTTSVISETVGNDTHQYLVETVAPGAAGVDYEWIAGVLLFAIMLYCLMKLFGGVLK